jgi:acyl carrier protein
MRNKVLSIINSIRISNDLSELTNLTDEIDLRTDLGFSSFDLAELTVKIEDEFDVDIFENGIISKVGEIFVKLGNNE